MSLPNKTSKMNKLTKFLAVCAFLAMALTFTASAQTDITGVISAVDGYRTAAVAVGIAILLYVIGRGVVRKIAK